ncbi:MAG TPA: XRE family transcriptional regulator [candidate division Zixibacteria bacterium]|nr:XRE family transcriptional regulator [candidate division Zixibacteria bacterium]
MTKKAENIGSQTGSGEDVSFAQWLRKCRESLGLTQKQFAQKLGISSARTIMRYEEDNYMPKARILPEISDLIQKEIDRLTKNDREGVLTAVPGQLKAALDDSQEAVEQYEMRINHSMPGPDFRNVLKKQLEAQLAFLIFLRGRIPNE